MPSSLFSMPRPREFNSAGAVLPGAKLYFYVSGTSTAATTYQNADLTVAHANPVVADAGGLFPAIWLSTTVTYDVTLKTTAGATVWTVSEVQGGVANTLTLTSVMSAEPYTLCNVNFAEPDGDVKGAMGYLDPATNALAVTSFEDAAIKISTGTPGDPTTAIRRATIYGDADEGYLSIQSNAAIGGATLKFTSQDEATTRGLVGFASVADSNLDITNSVSGGHIEFQTTGTGRVMFPLASGSAAAPMIATTTDPDTGIYYITNAIALAASGSQVAYFGNLNAYVATPLWLTAGSAGAPTLSELGATTGIYFDSTDVCFTSDAVNAVRTTETGISLKDGVTAPSTVAGFAQIYVDTADGSLKVKFGSGTVKTLATDP